MRQLTALDAQFLNVESATTAAHVAGLAIVDPAGGRLNRQALADLLRRRLHLAPALGLRLAEVPFGLDRPYWVTDAELDLDRHLFELTLPAPGGDRQLAEAVARIHARRLDRARPLWEMHLIHGLAGGLVGVYTKVHHAAIDGVSGAETLAALLDLTPDGPLPTSLTTSLSRGSASAAREPASMTPGGPADQGPAPTGSDASPLPGHLAPGTAPAPHADSRATEARADGGVACSEPKAAVDGEGLGLSGAAGGAGAYGREGEPGVVGMLAGAVARVAGQPVRAAGALVRAAADLDVIPLAGALPGARLVARAARALAGDRRPRPEVPEGPGVIAPRTPFNGPISAGRRLAFGSVSLKDVKTVARAHGLSVNDVVMALCTSALRSWLSERDALPEGPLVAAVPVAVREPEARDAVGNQISALIAPLPTHEPDARVRLREVGAAMAAAKRRFAVAPARWLDELCSMLPAPVTALATPAIFRLASVAFPPINLIISNVPGPQFPLYLCGGRVLSYYPMSVLTDMTGGVSITCFSYDGMLDFGVVACPERMSDVWSLAGHLRAALDELLEGMAAEADAYSDAAAPASG
ncbi:wax ester/triacylglycerol synthase domain-containing protein [Nonomuraea ceibae]|uniref:wax ester/triacylglycerol synthase domain-containing protein n=1 Tax=Nonomuraea ceibae TaxID=1935170 RepID=UPI001C607344|nr:wax ester/triacylglycerol synthase domain-containing protein [Nonomuraea ceibae]